MGEINIYPVVDDLAIDHFPEIHIADFDPLAGGFYAEKLTGMRCLLSAKGSGPFAHIKTCFVDA